MPMPVAAKALFAMAALWLLMGIIFLGVASSVARGYSKKVETAFIASRSYFILSEESKKLACDGDADGCGPKDTCNPFDLASSVPTFASFVFYNITNDVAVTAGATPSVEEVGPFACVTAPPYSEARISRTPGSDAIDFSADTVPSFDVLECPAVTGTAATISLYDKATKAVVTRPAAEWVDVLKTTILSNAGLIGTGGAPDFMSYPAQGNASIPNSYMRRVADDAPVLPIFPHAYVPDDGYLLQNAITQDTVLQWYLSSIGQTISLSWAYSLYYNQQTFDTPTYARFVGYIPSLIDLSGRASDLYDTAYSYHGCGVTDDASSMVIDADNYPSCTAKPEGDTVSPDDFFVDINLLLGIPAPILDFWGAGGWQAWQVGFDDVSPNCTAAVGDSMTVPFGWTWGFWQGGTMPYISFPQSGYQPFWPFGFGSGPMQGKWLAEFGVTRNDGVLPAFAFSMMPKMIPMISPHKVGNNFPFLVMGQLLNGLITDYMPKTSFVTTYMFLHGRGVLFYGLYFCQGLYQIHFYTGIFMLVYAFVPLALYGAYRMRADAKMA